MLVLSKNNLFFVFLVFGYIFGVMLYDFLGFNYTDELMAAFLVLFVGLIIIERKSVKELIPFIVLGGIFLFYIIYSLIIHSNTPVAIIKDAIIQIKPFLGFYSVLLLRPSLTNDQKRFLMILSLVCAGFLIIIGAVDHNFHFFGHPSRFATAATVTAFLFFYCSSYSWSDIVTFIVILSIGFFSTRSKFYGFWALTLLFSFYYKINGGIKFDIKTILLAVIAITLVLFFSWDKIVLYYIDGAMNSREMWSRPAMFLVSFKILGDYFPFGSGLGSFGTFISAEYYSSTYAEYGIDKLWGLSKENPSFIADAFYPELAQFGIVGVGLYVYFWFSIVMLGTKNKRSQMNKQYLIILLIFFFFLVEGVADATFTHNRGLFMLIIMAISLSELKQKYAVE